MSGWASNRLKLVRKMGTLRSPKGAGSESETWRHSTVSPRTPSGNSRRFGQVIVSGTSPAPLRLDRSSTLGKALTEFAPGRLRARHMAGEILEIRIINVSVIIAVEYAAAQSRLLRIGGWVAGTKGRHRSGETGLKKEELAEVGNSIDLPPITESRLRVESCGFWLQMEV